MHAVEVVIPVKAFRIAKSRLTGLPHRDDLARAMVLDTLTAVCAVVDRVVLVSDEPELASLVQAAGIDGPVEFLADPGAGLNAAIRAGDAHLGALRPGWLRIAMVADLPTIRPQDVQQVLTEARPHPRSLVVDAEGTGTTMLLSGQGSLRPHFGRDSARHHRADGALALTEVDPRARRDVDTADDLGGVLRLGPGPHTGAVLSRDALRARLRM